MNLDKENSDELGSLEAELEALDSKKNSLQEEKQDLQESINSITNEMRSVKKRIAEAKDANKTITVKRSSYEESQDAFKKLKLIAFICMVYNEGVYPDKAADLCGMSADYAKDRSRVLLYRYVNNLAKGSIVLGTYKQVMKSAKDLNISISFVALLTYCSIKTSDED